jgi:hypothetical protein
MTALRQFFAAAVLVLTLAVSISAGEITTGIASPQIPPATEGDIHATRAGDITTTGANAEDAGVSLADAAVALIQSLMSLF